jgi:hypothetical protein
MKGTDAAAQLESRQAISLTRDTWQRDADIKGMLFTWNSMRRI